MVNCLWDVSTLLNRQRNECSSQPVEVTGREISSKRTDQENYFLAYISTELV